MATKARGWPEEIAEWPANQSNAAADRDLAADKATSAATLARRGLDLAMNGKITRQEILYLFAVIHAEASDILRLMERNGAPTRPY